jgi:hypothetical protein
MGLAEPTGGQLSEVDYIQVGIVGGKFIEDPPCGVARPIIDGDHLAHLPRDNAYKMDIL